MLKIDRHGEYVIVHTYENGNVIRKYADHTFRLYNDVYDISDGIEKKWEELPIEVQNRGEAYDIECQDLTDPSEPELRKYQRNVLYNKEHTYVLKQVMPGDRNFSQFEIWRKKEYWYPFHEKILFSSHMSDQQAENVKKLWKIKKEEWNTSKKGKNFDFMTWHENWEKRNGNFRKWMEKNKEIHLLCERLLE